MFGFEENLFYIPKHKIKFMVKGFPITEVYNF